MANNMSRKGDCWENAIAEFFLESQKSEQVYLTKYNTKEEAKRDIVDYIEMFYNSKRRQSSLGNVNPNKFEKMWLYRKAAQKKCPFLLDHIKVHCYRADFA